MVLVVFGGKTREGRAVGHRFCVFEFSVSVSISLCCVYICLSMPLLTTVVSRTSVVYGFDLM